MALEEIEGKPLSFAELTVLRSINTRDHRDLLATIDYILQGNEPPLEWPKGHEYHREAFASPKPKDPPLSQEDDIMEEMFGGS